MTFSERTLPGIFCWVLAGRRSCSAWLFVSGIRRSWAKAQDVVGAVAQHLQQHPADRLGDGLGRAGDALDLRQPDGNPATEHLREHRQRARRDSLPALFTSEVGGMDQTAQRPLELHGPARVRVGLGAVFKITDQVGCTKLMLARSELWGIEAPRIFRTGPQLRLRENRKGRLCGA